MSYFDSLDNNGYAAQDLEDDNRFFRALGIGTLATGLAMLVLVVVLFQVMQ